MKTEPDVPSYILQAKERICHCLSKVSCSLSSDQQMPPYTQNAWLISTYLTINREPHSFPWFVERWDTIERCLLLSLINECSPQQDQQGGLAIPVCSEVLESEPDNVNVLKDRAEAYLQEEQYEEGTRQNVLCFSAVFLLMWMFAL